MDAQNIYRTATARQSIIKVAAEQSHLKRYNVSYRIEDLNGRLIEACGGMMVPGDALVTEALKVVNRVIAQFLTGEKTRG